MILFYKILGLVALLAALSGGLWKLDKSRQSIGYGRAVAEYTAQALKADQAARQREQELQSQVTKAQDDSKLRETKLSADAAAARRAANGLRDDLATIRNSLPSLAHDAIERYADTASIVFQECTDRYSDLAAKTDAIASDRQTLIDAWPR
jgi:hypothetical protein